MSHCRRRWARGRNGPWVRRCHPGERRRSRAAAAECSRSREEKGACASFPRLCGRPMSCHVHVHVCMLCMCMTFACACMCHVCVLSMCMSEYRTRCCPIPLPAHRSRTWSRASKPRTRTETAHPCLYCLLASSMGQRVVTGWLRSAKRAGPRRPRRRALDARTLATRRGRPRRPSG